MPIENFSGNPISSTYQRVVQTDGTYLGDGTGSLLSFINVTSSYAATASFAQNVNFTTRTVNTVLATEGQTVFTIPTGSDFLDVFINGAKLTTSEYTASGSILTIGSACELLDEVSSILYYNTSIVNLPTAYITKHDFSGSYSYCGRAVYGTVEAAPGWTISRIEILIDGTTDTKSATNVAWTDRYVVIYS